MNNKVADELRAQVERGDTEYHPARAEGLMLDAVAEIERLEGVMGIQEAQLAQYQGWVHEQGAVIAKQRALLDRLHSVCAEACQGASGVWDDAGYRE